MNKGMKKTVSLILGFVLSLTLFITDMYGIVVTVRAEDFEETDAGYEDDENGGGGGGDDSYDNSNDSNDNSNDSNDNNGGAYDDSAEIEEMRRRQQEEEEARQRALEEEARRAEEEAKRIAEEEAAQYEEAMRQAEEQAERIAKEAAEAEEAERKRAEAAAQQQYSLAAYLQSKPIKELDFGTAKIGFERDVFPLFIQNTGNTAVDLIYTKQNDADGAFSLVVRGDKTHLEPGEAANYYVSMNPALNSGNYSATVLFADATRDPAFTKALKLTVKGSVAAKKATVNNVYISPAKVTLAIGDRYQFSATVEGEGDYSDDVRWSVINNRSSNTSITSGGMLTLGADETASSISVVATSVANTAVSGTAVVTPQRSSVNVSAYADPSNGGSVTGGGAVVQGGNVTLSAAPAKNFYFVGWIRGGQKVSTATNYTITNVQSNTEVIAKFAQNYVTIKAVPNNKDAGNVVGGGNITYGSSTTLSAKAYSGYVFTGWKEGDTIISRDSSIKLSNLTVDRTITAMFSKTSYTLTLAANPSEGGTVSGGGTFSLGTGTVIKATPNAGYDFTEWRVNNQVVSRDREYKINKIEQDYTCTAIFTKKGITTYEISSGVATTGGQISPSGKISVAEGTDITYTITPKTGYAILAVAVDGAQVGPVSSYTFKNVKEPHMIAAAFVQLPKTSGNTAQTSEKKVEPIKKTEANTAKDNSTVNIEDAASGGGGDNYVVEMEDLEDIEIPSDEELSIIVEEETPEESSEVAALLGVSMDDIRSMVSQGDIMPVLDAEFYTGMLGAYVNNQYEPSSMNSIDYQNMSREDLMLASDSEINPSLPDLDIVVEKLLSADDVIGMAEGKRVDISVSLTEDAGSQVVKDLMKTAVGQKPLQYFDLTMLKTSNGYTERITELPTSMEVVIEVPDSIYKSGTKYSVLRVHDGTVSVLPDLDDDPKTITFKTDRFSSYAIAKEVMSTGSLVKWLIAGAVVAFGIALTCFLILISHQRRMRAARRANR